LPQVWAATHPVAACKTGAAEVLQKLPEVWPEGKAANKADLQALKICGDCEGASLCTGAGHTDAVAALAGVCRCAWFCCHHVVLLVQCYMIQKDCKGSKPEQRDSLLKLHFLQSSEHYMIM
jgi:hypothetical protein